MAGPRKVFFRDYSPTRQIETKGIGTPQTFIAFDRNALGPHGLLNTLSGGVVIVTCGGFAQGPQRSLKGRSSRTAPNCLTEVLRCFRQLSPSLEQLCRDEWIMPAPRRSPIQLLTQPNVA